MGIIDQWGNGLKLIADEMKAYPDIEFRWSEKGLQFQVQFSKRGFILLPQQELQQKLQQELQQNTLYSLVLKTIGEKTLTTKAILEALGQKEISGQLSKVIKVLLNDKLLVRTMPDKPNHPDQSLKLTQIGALFLKLMGSR